MKLLMGRRVKTHIKQSLLKPMAYDGERVQQSLTETGGKNRRNILTEEVKL
jgi:hypothetical protein